MPVFISYSHSDAEFVNKLAAHLVKRNAHIWVDTWELNVGDSILNRVQAAIQDSSALLVVLSKASVQSEWCKKELSAGLMRELDEKRVIVLPVLLEDCEIPVFLREKMYADFRENFDRGLDLLINSISRITNADQGRIRSGEGHSDWGVDWGFADGLFRMHHVLVETAPSWPFTLLTEVYLSCNDVVTRRYQEYVEAGLDWMGRLVVTEALAELGQTKDLRVILDSQFPQSIDATLVDPKIGGRYDVTAQCRRVGGDNGKDQLINISGYLVQIRDYSRKVSRPPTQEELSRVRQIVANRDSAKKTR